MSKVWRIAALMTVAVLFIAASSQAITRVAGRWSVLSVHGGYAKPWGQYDGLPNDPFVLEGRQWEFDAEDVYGDSYCFGLEYGQLIAGHWLGSVGFRFTHHNLKDTIGDERMAFMYDFKPTFNQYDLEVNMNYLLNNLASSVWTPYAGLGLHAGIASVDWDEYDAENDLTFGMNLNFGAEVKLYTAASGKSFVTLASMNNWNFMATNDRPKYLQIGGGVKYYMK